MHTNTASCDCDCFLPSGGFNPPPAPQADVRDEKGIDCNYTYTTSHTSPVPQYTPYNFAFASQPVFSATHPYFDNVDDPMGIQMPPPHIINHWFDWFDCLSLSLESTSWACPSNSAGGPSRFTPFDDSGHASSLIATL